MKSVATRTLSPASGLATLLAVGALAMLSPAPVFAESGKQLHDAICDGDLSGVKRSFARGHGVNQKPGKDGGYPLELAACCYGAKRRSPRI